MKLIVAFIKPQMLPDVILALHDIHLLPGISVTDVRGFGRGRAKDASDRVTEGTMDFLHRVRLETVCPDDLVEETIVAIERNAHTGLRGDGKIYVANVEQAIRISTGERGEAAV